jgi:hypothetical protein
VYEEVTGTGRAKPLLLIIARSESGLKAEKDPRVYPSYSVLRNQSGDVR